MLSLFIAASFGYWIAKHIDLVTVCMSEGNDFEIDFRINGMLEDFRWFWTAFCNICGSVIDAARTCRDYINLTLCPWAASYGVWIPTVPALRLPELSISDDRFVESLPNRFIK
jgi:hypothetical protein